MGFFKRLFFGKDLSEHLAETQWIKVQGIKFKIKRIDPLAYMDGSSVLLQSFQKYKVEPEGGKTPDVNIGKLKKHYIDVFLASVVSPELSRQVNDGDKIFVEYLFTDWSLAHELYESIIEFTYKKKRSGPRA